jgi:hypothetical protein
MDIKDLIIFSFAIVGAVLGVFNLARSYLHDSERVRVVVIEDTVSGVMGIEVVNWSPVPITVTELGTIHKDGRTDVLRSDPQRGDIDLLPKRIEARDAHRFSISLPEALAWRVHHPRYTYVRTALGQVFTTEPPSRRWVRSFREALGMKLRDL